MVKKTSLGSVIVAIAVCALLVMPMLGIESQAKTWRLTAGTVYPKKTMVITNLYQDFLGNEIEKRVAERTDHNITFNYAFAGTVAKHGEILEAVQKGFLDVGMITYPFEPAKLFLHSFGYYVPFNSVDIPLVAKVTLKLYDQFPVMKTVFEEKYAQKLLTIATIDSYQLITKRSWKKVEELSGRKIGGAGPNLDWIRAAGATPVQSKLSEMYTSAQTGVFEGIIMINDATLGYKLYEPCPYIAMANFGANPATGITINLKKFNSMPKEVQDIILEVSEEYCFETAKQLIAKRQQTIEGLRKAGATVWDVPEAERARWAEMMPNLPDKRAKEADGKGLPGSEFMRAFIGEMEKAGYQFPRKWVID
jgi:TRAP-type C4-dicarboxylate transport system substrate-binding protein